MNIFKNKVILVTGDTGFKGSWLALWLKELGAHVVGCSLEPPTHPNHFDILSLSEVIDHIHCDIREGNEVQKLFSKVQPDFVFHLAAQSLVIESYKRPKETFDSNIGGTVNILEAIKNSTTVDGAVIVTSDKCYENKNIHEGYQEGDPLGGSDPYSSSKAATELIVDSYRKSFFQRPGSPAVATVRAGNVIGGGDFAAHRIFPDLFRSIEEKKTLTLRNPKSVRPWLHVLDPLYGYLLLAEKLIVEGAGFAEAWNFGPQEEKGVTVKELMVESIKVWGEGEVVEEVTPENPLEADILRLNWEKAERRLGWKPKYSCLEAVVLNVNWYRSFLDKKDMIQVSRNQIKNYIGGLL